MMDYPKLYGKVERYKDFSDYCKRESKRYSYLEKFI